MEKVYCRGRFYIQNSVSNKKGPRALSPWKLRRALWKANFMGPMALENSGYTLMHCLSKIFKHWSYKLLDVGYFLCAHEHLWGPLKISDYGPKRPFEICAYLKHWSKTLVNSAVNSRGGGYSVEKWVRGCVAQIGCIFSPTGFSMTLFILKQGFKGVLHPRPFFWLFMHFS